MLHGRLCACLLFGLIAACPLGAAGPALTPLVHLTLDSDKLQYDQTGQAARMEGPTTIRGEVQGQPQQRLLVETSQADADFAAQSVHAGPPVELVGPRLDLTGATLDLDLARSTFRMQDARTVMDVAGLGKSGADTVLVLLEGKVVGGGNGVVYMENGTFTPSVVPKPDLVIHARRIEYSQLTRRFTITGGSLDLYGLRIPMLPKMKKRLRQPGGRPQSTTGFLPALTWGSRDGLAIPYFFEFSGDKNPTLNTAAVTLTQKRGLAFLGESRREAPSWSLVASVSRLEDVTDKLIGRLTYHRLPEVFAERYQHSREQNRGWHVAGSVGNFLEQDESAPGLPDVHRQRYLLGAGYEWGSAQRLNNLGQWAELWGTQAFYSAGEHFTDVTATVGAGHRWSPRLAGALTLIHHFTNGATPFKFDAADLSSEARPLLDIWPLPSWRVLARGRWDLKERRLRDYQLDLSKRSRCLTWTVFYHFVGKVIGVRFDINGLTGDTAPPPQTGPDAERYFAAQARLNAPMPPMPVVPPAVSP